ncbi:UNVERIFIED_CONTAM: L-aspartate oxidase, chloroplastic [Sesamum radiatum]|uniref:L-aspartate oxidase n=1 Tax=Sesamum radiatum TaxID=300843 RepID=A0AAW2P4Y4_SESRA
MATSVASGSGRLHFKDPVYRGQGCRQAHWVQNIAVPRCMQKELSWSHGVSKGLLTKKHNYSHPQIKEDRKQSRVVIKSCLREGYNKYFDFAVIGSGIAGLRYALEVAKHGTVAVITKAEPHESNTNYAQGGVSAVLCPSDSVENHVQDTIIAGAYLCDEETVRDGSDTVCHGVDTLNTETQDVVRFISKVTLLASGGAGHIYPSTTNPPVATGDGMAMAHRAQALISNMEFVQFHPTALADVGLPIKPREARENAFLITEAVRGDGGILYNLGMERFMPFYDKRAELAPRDVVARSIDDQLKKRNEKYVLLDISHKPKENILSHFPNIAAECLRYGLDITQQPIPVVPAAHYMCGGVRAGLQGETNVRGLYVAGEVACTGLHGANRLASNSLLEALVFARRAVQPSIDHMRSSRIDLGASRLWSWPVMPKSLGDTVLNNIVRRTREVRKELQLIMWEYVGIVRSTTRLQTAEKRIGELELEWETYLFQQGWEPTMVGIEACEMRNLFCCSKLVVSSALARHESRGLHYTIDFPHVEESMRLPTVIFPCSPVNSTWSSRQLHRQQIC